MKVITSGDDTFPRAADRQRQSTVSVLVPSFGGVDVLATCLDSLADQTLERHRFEVVVVHSGPEDGTVEVVDLFRARNPKIHIRLMELREGGAGRARNIALSVARGEYVTFVDDDDWVTPAYLEAMLEEAEPDVVAVAMVADVTSRDPEAPRDLDTNIGRALREVTGRTVAPQQLTTPFFYNAGKLVLTAAARAVQYDTSLRSGDDLVFWLQVFARAPLPVPRDSRPRPTRRTSVSCATVATPAKPRATTSRSHSAWSACAHWSHSTGPTRQSIGWRGRSLTGRPTWSTPTCVSIPKNTLVSPPTS